MTSPPNGKHYNRRRHRAEQPLQRRANSGAARTPAVMRVDQNRRSQVDLLRKQILDTNSVDVAGKNRNASPEVAYANASADGVAAYRPPGRIGPTHALCWSLLKQVWVGMAPVRCRPSQKNPRVRGLCFAP